MKLVLLHIFLITLSPLLFAEEVEVGGPNEKLKPKQVKQEPSSPDYLTLKDPRPTNSAFSLTFDNGVAQKNYEIVPLPILVIHWQPPSDPDNPELAEAKFGNGQSTPQAWQISDLLTRLVNPLNQNLLD
jgi:hypothetical protein